jgi:hypothetical protein
MLLGDISGKWSFVVFSVTGVAKSTDCGSGAAQSFFGQR